MLVRTTIRTVFKRCSVVFLAVLLAMVSVFPALNSVVEAQAQPQTAPLSKTYLSAVKRRSIAQAFHECIKNDAYNFVGGTDFRKIASGDWAVDKRNPKPFVGPLVDSDDGRYDCNEIVKSVRNDFGFNSFTELFCAVGGKYNGLDKCSDAKEGNKGFVAKANANHAYQTLKGRTPSGLPENDATLDYVLALGSLTEGEFCKTKDLGLYSSLSDGDKNDHNVLRIFVANTDGTTSERGYKVLNPNKSVPMFASGFHRGNGGGGVKAHRTCQQLATWVSENAQSYATQVKRDEINAENETYDKTARDIALALGARAQIDECRRQLHNREVDECDLILNDWLKKIAACKPQILKLIQAGGGQRIKDDPDLIECLKQNLGMERSVIQNLLGEAIIVKPTGTPSADCAPGDTSCQKEAEKSCSIEGLGYIICPAMLFLSDMMSVAFNYISDQFLTFEVDFIKNNQVRNAWSQFRNIANVIFIVMFLIIIFSQVTNLGISNYGIKKLLPKLIIVALLINLSFILCQIVIDLSNIVGKSVNQLFSLDLLKNTYSGGEVVSSSINPAQAKLLTATVIALGGPVMYLLLPFLFSALVGGLAAVMLVAFLLTARKAILLLLIITAPLALASLLLPNTEKLFSRWRSLFISLLLLFPIIGLLFGASWLAASILNASAGSDSIMPQIISLAITSIPLFATLPLLKGSLDATGKLGATLAGWGNKLQGVAAGKGKELAENSRLHALKEYRKGERAKNRALTQSGAYEGRNPFRIVGSRVNRVVNSAIPGSFGRRSAARGYAIATEAKDKAIREAELAIMSSSRPEELLDYAGKVAYNAAVKGDAIQARAAAKILANKGTPGKTRLQDVLHSLENTPKSKGSTDSKMTPEMRSAFATQIDIENLKATNNVLSSWAYGNDSIADVERTASTFSGLNAVEWAGQSIHNLRDAYNSRAITAKQAQDVLENATATALLNKDTRQFFEYVVSHVVPPGIIDENGKKIKHPRSFTTPSEIKSSKPQ